MRAAPPRRPSPLTFALVGNQNCGKTTLFNQLTGSQPARGQLPRRHGGPQGRRASAAMRRRTVDGPAGHLLPVALLQRGDRHAATSCWTRSRDGIINIVDATNIERNLYLTHAADGAGHAHGAGPEHDGRGARPTAAPSRVNELERRWASPWCPSRPSKNEGIAELVDHALHVARFQEPPVRQRLLRGATRTAARCTAASTRIMAPHRATTPSAPASPCGSPRRKLVEGDPLDAGRKLRPRPERAGHRWSTSCARWRPSAAWTARRRIADMRFAFIEKRLRRRAWSSRTRAASTRAAWRIDRLLTGTFTAIPCVLRPSWRSCSG